MHAVAISVILMAGACGEPLHGDCNNCVVPHKKFCHTWRAFWCGISKPADCACKESHYWPLDYPPHYASGTSCCGGCNCGIGGCPYDYRREFGYPWRGRAYGPANLGPYGRVPPVGASLYGEGTPVELFGGEEAALGLPPGAKIVPTPGPGPGPGTPKKPIKRDGEEETRGGQPKVLTVPVSAQAPLPASTKTFTIKRQNVPRGVELPPMTTEE